MRSGTADAPRPSPRPPWRLVAPWRRHQRPGRRTAAAAAKVELRRASRVTSTMEGVAIKSARSPNGAEQGGAGQAVGGGGVLTRSRARGRCAGRAWAPSFQCAGLTAGRGSRQARGARGQAARRGHAARRNSAPFFFCPDAARCKLRGSCRHCVAPFGWGLGLGLGRGVAGRGGARALGERTALWLAPGGRRASGQDSLDAPTPTPTPVPARGPATSSPRRPHPAAPRGPARPARPTAADGSQGMSAGLRRAARGCAGPSTLVRPRHWGWTALY